MAANTTLLDFHVDPAVIADPSECHELLKNLERALSECGLDVFHTSQLEKGFLLVMAGTSGSHALLRCYANGLITLTLEEYVFPDAASVIFSSEERGLAIEQTIGKAVNSCKSKRLPAIKRGGKIDPYVNSSDDRILEYDFDESLYEANSQYQNIKILHSLSFGNLLILDDLQNLAESDLIYTQTLMRHGILDYAGKTVLILGGGDGALLHEMLKEEPAFVTMIEIDQMVMDACKKHMRAVCGDSLDTHDGPNHKIVVDDCLKVMEQFVADNRNFDYVIGDLTDIPLTPTPQGEFWDFIRKILDLSFRILAPGGKFLTHGNGIGSLQALKMYEQQLDNLHCPVEYQQYSAYVPSFMECWAFYEVWRREDQPSSTDNGIASPPDA